MISISQCLLASDFFKDGKLREDVVECVGFQPHQDSVLYIYCARRQHSTKTVEDLVAELIKEGIPPHRIYPFTIKLGHIMGLQAKVML